MALVGNGDQAEEPRLMLESGGGAMGVVVGRGLGLEGAGIYVHLCGKL